VKYSKENIFNCITNRLEKAKASSIIMNYKPIDILGSKEES